MPFGREKIRTAKGPCGTFHFFPMLLIVGIHLYIMLLCLTYGQGAGTEEG